MRVMDVHLCPIQQGVLVLRRTYVAIPLARWSADSRHLRAGRLAPGGKPDLARWGASQPTLRMPVYMQVPCILGTRRPVVREAQGTTRKMDSGRCMRHST
jgi:hypothetical protein